MYIGASFMTAIEIMEFFVMICRLYCKKSCRERGQQRKTRAERQPTGDRHVKNGGLRYKEQRYWREEADTWRSVSMDNFNNYKY